MKNRTLIEAARTMLEESKLPTYFWAEAINIACYTQNISITSTDKSSLRNLNSFSMSMNLGGASQSRRSFINKESPPNDQEASSSKSNLPPQRKWTKSHPFELIIGDAGYGV